MSLFTAPAQALADEWQRLADSKDLDALVAFLDDLRRFARDDLKVVELMAEARIVELWPGGGWCELAGRVVEIRSGSKSTAWDHDALFARAVALASDERPIDLETGECLEPEGVTVARVIADMAGISYWRKTRLRERGLDPDDFTTTTVGPKKITIGGGA